MGILHFIRVRYLGSYKDLREPPLVKANADDLHPDVNNADPPAAFHDYLDEFLQAIRVFGFLEKPVRSAWSFFIRKRAQVFHELARHVQTRRIIAGDTLSLDEDKSFYCVMDGVVQVYARSGQRENENGEVARWDNEHMNGYQLLNEVGSGGTLSSLFTILSLFTEDVQIAWQEPPQSDLVLHRGPNTPAPAANDNGISFELVESPKLTRRARSMSKSSTSSTVHPIVTEPMQSPSRSPMSVSRENSIERTPEKNTRGRSLINGRSARLNHGSVARATVDTTLAVIPAEAFTRLTKKFPKASGHIVQGQHF